MPSAECRAESAVAILSAATVAPLAAGDPERFVQLSAALALLTGGILLFAGTARLGFISEFLARPVITGYTIGLGLVIAVGQAPKLVGVSVEAGNFFEELWRLIAELDKANLETLDVGAGSLALILALNRLVPKLPSALITVAAGIIVVAVFDLDEKGASIVGDIPEGLPPFGAPGVGLGDILDLLPGAIALAILAYAESIAGARSFAGKHDYEVRPNQELIALGTSNIGAGFVQGFAVDASVSRSAVGDAQGMRTQLAGLINLGLVILTLVLLTPLFHDLPTATLAAVVIAAVLPLITTRELRRLWRLDAADFGIAIVCLAGVLLLGVLGGIGVAVIVSLIPLVRRGYRPNYAVLGRVPNTDEHDEDYRFRDVATHPGYETFPGLIIFRFDNELFFANANFFRDQIRQLVREADPAARAVLVDASGVTHIDTTALDVLTELRAELAAQDVQLLVARARTAVRDELDRAGLVDAIGEENFFESVRGAVAAFERAGRLI